MFPGPMLVTHPRPVCAVVDLNEVTDLGILGGPPGAGADSGDLDLGAAED